MQRFSKKREAVYACLRGTHLHPSADWIYRQLRPDYPDLSLATVYRNLTQLKAAGRIQSVGTVDGQERFDADVHPHSHLVCSRCGAVCDVEIRLPEQMARQTESQSGWLVSDASLRLTGLCPRCRQTII